MKLALLTLRWDDEEQRFDDAPLQDFQQHEEGQGRTLLEASEHFFLREGIPHLAMVLRYRDAARTTPSPKGRPTPEDERRNWRKELSTEERPLYDALRQWRDSAGHQNGLVPFLILTNQQMALIARQRPTTLNALQSIPGFGQGRAKRWGEAILRVLGVPSAPDAPAQTPPEAPPQDAPSL